METPPQRFLRAQPCSAEHSLALPGGGDVLQAVATVFLLSKRCSLALSIDGPSWAGSHLIQDRLQDCFIFCALHNTS